MRTIQELTAGPTQEVAGLEGQAWRKAIVYYAEALRRLDQACITDTTLLGKPDKTVTIPKTSGHLTLTTTPPDQTGTTENIRTLTRLDTILSSVDVTVDDTTDWYMPQIAIRKQDVENHRVDLIKLAQRAMAQDLADKVDKAVATVLQGAGVTNVVYGGTATAVDGLATGNVLTPDTFADALQKIEDTDFVPWMAFLPATQCNALRKDPQFTNAAEYGSDGVVLKGQIKEYLGVKIIKTSNAPAYASGATDTNESTKTWGAAGHVGFVIGVGSASDFDAVKDNADALMKVAVALAWKHKEEIGYWYDPDAALHKIWADMAFKAKLIQADAVCLIKVTDA